MSAHTKGLVEEAGDEFTIDGTGDDKSFPTVSSEERRISVDDGYAYTKEEFIEYYGGTAEWEVAEPAKAGIREETVPVRFVSTSPLAHEQPFSHFSIYPVP